MIQASALETIDTIFVCGSRLEHSTLYKGDECKIGNKLVGVSDGSSSGLASGRSSTIILNRDHKL